MPSTGAGVIACALVVLACRGAPPARLTAAVDRVPTPGVIRIPLTRMTVREPHRASVVFVAAPPAYDGPAPTAILAPREVSARLRPLVRARAAAVAEMRRLRDRRDPSDQAAMERVQTTLAHASEQLRARLDTHAAVLTIAGAVLRAELHLEHAERALLQQLVEAEARGQLAPDVRIDTLPAQRVLEELFARLPAAEADPEARFAFARILHTRDARAGALLFYSYARDFPTSPQVEAAYEAAAHGLFGNPDRLSEVAGREAYEWLAAHATSADRRAAAQFRLAQLHDRARAWPQVIAQLCPLVDDPRPGLALVDDATGYLSRAIIRGGIGPLRTACPAAACPCREPVLADAIAHLRRVDHDDVLGEALALARTHFPQSAHAASWSCERVRIAERSADERTVADERTRHAREHADDRSCAPVAAPRDPSAIAGAHVESGAIAACAEDAREQGRLQAFTFVMLEVTIGARGLADRSVVRTADVDVGDCIRAWLTRHRWTGLEHRVVIAPVAITAG